MTRPAPAATLQVVVYAHTAYLADIADTDPHRRDPPSRLETFTLARWLTTAVDAVQQQHLGRTDRTHPTWDVCWDATRAAIDAHPIPFGQPPHDRDLWWHAVVERGAELLQIASDLDRETIRR